MIPGSALASRAIGDVARRDLASEWGGPDPGAGRSAERGMQVSRDTGRRAIVRKP